MANFPGINSVLGNGDHIYTIQATIAEKHRSPAEGIQKVWVQLLPEIRRSFTWHFVVIADRRSTAETYVEKFTEEMDSFTLGTSRESVQVWAGVL